MSKYEAAKIGGTIEQREQSFPLPGNRKGRLNASERVARSSAASPSSHYPPAPN
jgi:hypothetical protein